MTNQAFCPHCGAAVAPGARFCRSCGKDVSAAPAAAAQQPGVYPPVAAPAPKSNATMLLIGGAAIVVLAVAAFATGIVGGGDDKSSSSSSGVTGGPSTNRDASGTNAFKNISYKVPSGWNAQAVDRPTGEAILTLSIDGGSPKGASIVAAYAKAPDAREPKAMLTATGGQVKDVTYGGMKGAEVRFNRPIAGDGDYVNVNTILAVGNTGFLLNIAYLTPAAQDGKYAAALKSFLDSLQMK